MAIADITKPMALDETLQATNTALGTLNTTTGGIAKDTTLQTTNGKMDSVITKLQGIIDALGIKTSVYKAGGDKTCAELVPALLIEDYCGYVYNITDTGTTTSDFVEGAGKPINIGDNVGIVDRGTGGNHVYKFDLMAGMVDLTDYIKKSSTSGFVKNDGTIDTTTYQPTEQGKGLSSNDYTTTEKNKLAGISTNANKVESSTTNGNIKIDDTETTVYDDTEIKTELSTDTTEIEGNSISFNTLTAQNASECVIDLDPIQDLHGFDKPWVGGAGYNKWDEDYEQGNLNWDTGLPTSSTNYLRSKNYCSITSGVNLYVVKNGYTVAIFFYDSSYALVGKSTGETVTAPATAIYFKIRIGDGTTTMTTETGIAVNYPSTVTTYSPYKNECPISGRTEANLEGCGKNLISGYKTNTSIDSNGEEQSNSGALISNRIFVKSGQSYVLSGTKNGTKLYHKYNKYGSYLGYVIVATDAEFQIENDVNSIILQWNKNGEGTVLPVDGQLELGSSATTYEPYTESNDLNIAFGQTVYGCHIDVKRGVLTVDKVIETFDGDENWVIWQPGTGHSFRCNTSQIHVQPADTHSVVASTKTNYLSLSTPADTYSSLVDYSLSLDGDNYRFSICLDSSINTEAKCKTFLANNPLQVCYELATPTTIQLTPHEVNLLKGANYISTDGDKIEITYRSGEVATLGDLKDAVDDMSAKLHIYSTDEQVVGTWIDGKTLYEKTIATGTLPNNSSINLSTPSNIKEIIHYFGYIKSITSSTYQRPIPFPSGGSNDIRVDLTNGTLKITTYDDWSDYSGYLIIQYTKTTD